MLLGCITALQFATCLLTYGKQQVLEGEHPAGYLKVQSQVLPEPTHITWGGPGLLQTHYKACL